MPFQNWHEKFDELWLKHSKVSKIYILLGCFWPKYIILVLKKSTEVLYFMTRESDAKFEKKNDLWFGKWHEEFGKFSPQHLKASKLGLWWHPFVPSWKCMSLKFKEDLCVMTRKNDAKIEEESTCQSKIDINNLTNFDLSIRKSQKFAL